MVAVPEPCPECLYAGEWAGVLEDREDGGAWCPRCGAGFGRAGLLAAARATLLDVLADAAGVSRLPGGT